MLRLEHVYAGYEGREVLHDISMHIEPGKITVLAGPNGCGKSTLLKTMIQLVPRTKGNIFFGEQPQEMLAQNEVARFVSYLPQKRSVPEIEVLRMVLHGRFPYLSYPRRYREEDYRIAKKALAWLDMEKYAGENVGRLSGGMQQKVYIAMALAQDTPVILMDEPTTYLDMAHQIKVMEIAKRLADQGKAVVLVLHDLPMALREADEIYVLHEGEIACSGSPEKVFQSGVLDEVFGVVIKRVQTEEGWQYYY